ncbi:WD repeat-containing protein 44-like protein, partial [Tanacetum coccineum]
KDSMSGSKSEREKDDCATETTTTATTTNDKSSSTSSQTKEEQKASGEQKPSGEQITSGEQKTSTDKNSNSEWVKAKVHGKPMREFSALHICQQIVAHDGSIWTMRFSTDGHYLASGGEDKVIHIWQVQECDVMSLRSGDDNGSITPDNRITDGSTTTSDKKKTSKNIKKKSGVPDYVKVPESVFGLSEKPVCTFKGHQEDILDLAWSRSQLLISSSMDKTVRLWDIKKKSCLKQFAHSDYVTCIQFNPTDDDYFISGSLDKKVRIWSVPSRKVIGWSDLHDMITSVCYSPDGQVAIVGLHNGNCISYSTTDCKLDQKNQIELHTKPKAEASKITSFQFSPSSASEMLVTSADSRVRILDGLHVVNKLIEILAASFQLNIAQMGST